MRGRRIPKCHRRAGFGALYDHFLLWASTLLLLAAFVWSFKGEGARDGLKEQHRRAPSGAALTDLVPLLQQFEDAIDGFERSFVGNNALLHEQVQYALAQHQAGLAFGVRAHRSFPFWFKGQGYLWAKLPCYKVDRDFCGTVGLRVSLRSSDVKTT
jgi:hypothetical protein